MFSSKINGFQRGEILGGVIGRILILVLIYFMFKWGKKNVTSKTNR